MPLHVRFHAQNNISGRITRFAPCAIIAVCILLITCSQTALAGASDALALWWNRVLPALFPFYVLTTLLNRCGALMWLCRKLRSRLLPCLLFGIFGGYPTGARICRMLGCEPYARCCNLCSPAFIMGVVAVGMCKDASLFLPLAVAHYGSAALLLPTLKLDKTVQAPLPDSVEPVNDGSMIGDITAGMQAMLGIGGCIVFFYVPVHTLLAVTLRGRYPLVTAILAGMAELTSGCRLVAELALPLNVRMGILAFFVTFGGVCVFAQTMMVANLAQPTEYLLSKGMQGCIAAILAYLITPLGSRQSVAVLSDTAQIYAQNALIGATFLASACIGLVGCYLLALVCKQTNKKATRHHVA